MEYKALSRGEGHSSVSSRPKKKVAVRMRAIRRRRPAKANALPPVWGAVYLDAAAFAEFEKCIQTPQRPTESIYKGAELIRSLYHRKNR